MYTKRVLLTVSFLTLSCASACLAADWPQFRGPDRDAVSKETGLLRSWPESGPEVLWTTEVGDGYSSPAVFDGRVYVNDYNKETRRKHWQRWRYLSTSWSSRRQKREFCDS